MDRLLLFIPSQMINASDLFDHSALAPSFPFSNKIYYFYCLSVDFSYYLGKHTFIVLLIDILWLSLIHI